MKGEGYRAIAGSTLQRRRLGPPDTDRVAYRLPDLAVVAVATRTGVGLMVPHETSLRVDTEVEQLVELLARAWRQHESLAAGAGVIEELPPA